MHSIPDRDMPVDSWANLLHPLAAAAHAMTAAHLRDCRRTMLKDALNRPSYAQTAEDLQ